MRLYLKRLVSEWGDVEWVVYEEGGYRHPLVIISEYELERLIEQYEEKKAAAATDEPARKD